MPKQSGNPIRQLMRIPVPWVFVLGYLVGAGLELAIRPYPHTERPGGIAVAGGGVFGIGAVIAGWGWLIFRRARTTTIPGRTSSSLITRGPYRFTRNPMYVGLVLAYLGEAGMLKQLWPVILLPFILVYLNRVVIPVEEARLIETFGSEYEQYRARVRRWI